MTNCEPYIFRSLKRIEPLKKTKPLKRGYYANIRTDVKIGRNEPCPCGSGKKYKYCCK